MFNDLVGDLDVIVGQFQVSDPLFKGELRLSLRGIQNLQNQTRPFGDQSDL